MWPWSTRTRLESRRVALSEMDVGQASGKRDPGIGSDRRGVFRRQQRDPDAAAGDGAVSSRPGGAIRHRQPGHVQLSRQESLRAAQSAKPPTPPRAFTRPPAMCGAKSIATCCNCRIGCRSCRRSRCRRNCGIFSIPAPSPRCGRFPADETPGHGASTRTSPQSATYRIAQDGENVVPIIVLPEAQRWLDVKMEHPIRVGNQIVDSDLTFPDHLDTDPDPNHDLQHREASFKHDELQTSCKTWPLTSSSWRCGRPSRISRSPIWLTIPPIRSTTWRPRRPRTPRWKRSRPCRRRAVRQGPAAGGEESAGPGIQHRRLAAAAGGEPRVSEFGQGIRAAIPAG